jgi:hypothetical protein
LGGRHITSLSGIEDAQKKEFCSSNYSGRISKTKVYMEVKYDGKAMPLIRCKCGCQILVVPDLKAMNRAIRQHLKKHFDKSKGLPKASPAMDSLEQFLVEQIITALSETK